MISSKLIRLAEQEERERRPKIGFQQLTRELDVGAKDKRRVRRGRREGVEEREREVWETNEGEEDGEEDEAG